MPLDPISLGIGGVQTLFGLGQSIFGGGARRKAERELEKMANSYQPNAGILDYYNKALAKYNANPYQSQAYQNESNQIQRNLSTGINSAQDRRSGLMAIAGLTQQANDANAKAVSRAEGIERQNLGILGNATNLKAAEDRRKFDMLYNLKAMKAGQKAGVENAGYRNIFGGLGTMATLGVGTLPNRGTRNSYGQNVGADYYQDDSLPQ